MIITSVVVPGLSIRGLSLKIVGELYFCLFFHSFFPFSFSFPSAVIDRFSVIGVFFLVSFSSTSSFILSLFTFSCNLSREQRSGRKEG